MRSSNTPLLIILILGLVLRVFNINQSLWLDEATSVLVAKNFSFTEIVTKFSVNDFHPPLYYFLLKVWGTIFGWSEIAVRSLSLIFGLATVHLIFKIGSKIVNERVGLMAALLLSTGPLHIYYSQETRMYVPETFFVTLLIWNLLQVFEQEKNKWLMLTISTIAVLSIDYLPILVFPAILLYLLGNNKHELKKHKRHLVRLALIVTAFTVAWIPVFTSQIKTSMAAQVNAPLWIEVLGGSSLKQIALIPIKFIIGRISFYNKFIYATYIFAALFVYIWPFLNSLRRRKEVEIIWLWFFVPLILAIILGFQFSVLSYFRLIFILPAFYLLVAFGLSLIKNNQTARLIMMLMIFFNLVSVGIYHFSDRFKRENWKEAVTYVENSSKGEKAASIFVTKNQRDAYIYYQNSVQSYSYKDFDNNMYDRVWLFRYIQPIFDPQDNARKKIELLGFKKVEEKDFNGVTVWEYRK